MGDRHITVRDDRTGTRLGFVGRLLARRSTRTPHAARWWVVSVYRTESCLVLAISGASDLEGERDRHLFFTGATAYELRAAAPKRVSQLVTQTLRDAGLLDVGQRQGGGASKQGKQAT